jgi:actin-related protein
MDAPPSAAVLHLGSATTRAGFAYDMQPFFVSETISTGIEHGLTQDWEAYAKAAQTALHTLRARGKSRALSSSAAERKGEGEASSEEAVDDIQRPLLFVDSVSASDKAREKLAEVAFEQLHAPSAFALADLVGGVYSAGRTSGVIFDAGASCTHAAAVYEGFVLPHTLQRLPLGGNDLTAHLRACLAERGVELAVAPAEALKRAQAEVALDFVKEAFERRAKVLPSPKAMDESEEESEDESEEDEDEDGDEAMEGGSDAPGASSGKATGEGDKKSATQQQQEQQEEQERRRRQQQPTNVRAVISGTSEAFELPDGRRVALSDEMLRCGEVLFQPGLVGCASAGLGEQLAEVVRICLAEGETAHVQSQTRFILGMGGTSMLPGLDSRLHKELTAGNKSLQTYVSTLQEPERWHAAWIGGSIVASLPSFVETNFVSKAEYDEVGSSAMLKRC